MLASDQLSAIQHRVSELIELLDRAIEASPTTEDAATLSVAIQFAESLRSTLEPGTPVKRLSSAALCDDRR